MAAQDRIFIMREAITKLTQMLAGRGIQVTQRGISAFVRADKTGRPYHVNLPYIPDNANMELLDAIQGFLDHEVAHILFTEFNKMGEAHKYGAGGMLNLIEDSRIERAMADRFQGSAENMARMGKFFLDKYTTPKMNEALKNGDTEELVAVLTVPLVRMMAGQQIFAEFMKDKMDHVQEVYDKIKDLAPKIEGAKSTNDCLELAKTIVKRLRDGEPAPADENEEGGASPMPTPKSKGGAGKPSKGAGKGDESDESEASGSSGKGDNKDEEEKEEKKNKGASAGSKEEEKDADEGEEEKEEGEEEEKKEGEEEEAKGKGDRDEEVGDEDEDGTIGDMSAGGDDGDEGGGEASDGPMTPPEEGEEIDIAKPSSISWEAIDRETAKDYDDVASSLITDTTAKAASVADYLVYSTDSDIVEPLKIGSGYADTMLTGLQDKVDHMVGPLQKDLERAISARSLSHWNPGHRSGRINAAALSRLATNDDRVFRRKVESTTKDVAVELLVDLSGSMDGEKIHTATQAAYALSATLDRIGIPNEVMAFTTGAGMGDMATIQDEEKKLGRTYSRYEQLYMPILKSFTERMTTETKKRFGWLPYTSAMRNNVDGECVEIAGRRLLARKEKGKILIVLSDGAPHAYSRSYSGSTLSAHLKKVVENLSRTGMKVIGIGIQSSEVKKFYPKNFVINKVEELPVVVMKELRQLIAG